MQNVIRAPRSGVIKKLYAEEGSSLMTDEVIVEFEKTDWERMSRNTLHNETCFIR